MDTRIPVICSRQCQGTQTRFLRYSACLKKEDGYALPSVLFLVTILTLVAFLVILLDFLDRQITLRQVARVKAEYAAQSGAIRSLEALTREASYVPFAQKLFSFDDGSEALVRVQPWGIYRLVESQGYYRGLRQVRFACVGVRPPDAFRQALVLGNNQHQLVFTGSSQIKGDVSIGPAGATTGSLHGYSTPASLPLQGHITSDTPGKQMPQIDRDEIRKLRQYYESLLAHNIPPDARVAALAPGEALSSLADSMDIAFASGRINLENDSLSQRTRPLLVVAPQGPFTLAAGIHVEGPLTIVSGDSIFVGRGALLEHVVLYSSRSIAVRGAQLVSSQLLAPRITIDSATVASYPSALISIAPSGAAPLRQTIHVTGASRIEGFVSLDSPFADDLVIVDPDAKVVGAIYSTGRVTLDGDVVGSVLASDLYFYEAPTMYLGWLRSGRIDRTALPEGFLVPPILSGGNRLYAILEWL